MDHSCTITSKPFLTLLTQIPPVLAFTVHWQPGYLFHDLQVLFSDFFFFFESGLVLSVFLFPWTGLILEADVAFHTGKRF